MIPIHIYSPRTTMSLRSAARTAALEDSVDIKDALFDAADDVALKHGLDSPTKHRMQKRFSEESENRSPKENYSRSDSRSVGFTDDANIIVREVKKQEELNMDADVRAMGQEMGIKLDSPKSNISLKIDDKFDETSGINQKRARDRKKDRSRADEVYDPATDRNNIRYQNARRSIEQRRQSSEQSKRASRDEPPDPVRSRIAKELERSDPRVSAVFKSAHEEALFRGMHRMASADKKSQGKRKGASGVRRSEDDLVKTAARISSQRLQSQEEPDLYQLLLMAARPETFTDRAKKYALYEDAENCTFRPKIKKNANTESGAEGAAKSNFIDRQEATEKSRVDEIEQSRGKKEYDAIVDKKFCPRCGAKKSYDDVKENRKKCNNCNIEYTTKIAWNKVKNDFYKRQHDQLLHKDQHRQELAQTLQHEEKIGYRTKFDWNKEKIVVEYVDFSKSTLTWDEEVEQEFYERMRTMDLKKQAKLKKLEQDLYGSVGSLKSSVEKDSSTPDLDYYDMSTQKPKLFGIDSATAFLQRYEEDVKRRNAIKAAQREQEKFEKSIMSRTEGPSELSAEHPKAFKP